MSRSIDLLDVEPASTGRETIQHPRRLCLIASEAGTCVRCACCYEHEMSVSVTKEINDIPSKGILLVYPADEVVEVYRLRDEDDGLRNERLELLCRGSPRGAGRALGHLVRCLKGRRRRRRRRRRICVRSKVCL